MFMVHGLGCMVYGLWFMVQGLGLRGEGLVLTSSDGKPDGPTKPSVASSEYPDGHRTCEPPISVTSSAMIAIYYDCPRL